MKDVVGRQRRATAIMSLISDLDQNKEQPQQEEEPMTPRRRSKALRASTGNAITGRRGSALMSLITGLGDEDSEEEGPSDPSPSAA